MAEAKEQQAITTKDLKSVFWRSFFIMSTINYERFQNLGFTFCMAPILRKLYTSKESMKEALQRHIKMYNSHPWMANPILGTVIALEEKNDAEEGIAETINNVKVGLMGPFAGIGDSLFWGTIRPILLGIGASFALQGSIIGPILFLVSWNILNFGFRYYSLMYGYRAGVSMLRDLKQTNIVQKISEGASVLGLIVLGVLVASWVSINTPIAIKTGDSAIKLQEVLNSIMPSMLPLIATLIMVFFLRKGTKPNTILLGIFISSFIASIFGILQ
ncbi:MAG: PTS system mannose/fructose/sorbose family transporter subunit IID [Tepidanaerobacteraceae bacterium]|nr:PTS system mannose/fructose/sorbose family transporter subunit IID [Tepidanaerobacteraceae bacterium]